VNRARSQSKGALEKYGFGYDGKNSNTSTAISHGAVWRHE
jgi:hypothetical protein